MSVLAKRKFPIEAAPLYVTNGLNSVVKIFTKIFLSVYFLKITDWNFSAVILYYIIYYASTALFNYMAGNWTKCHNKMIPYRFGIMLQFIFFLSLILLKDNAAQYIYYLAVISGASTAYYWLPYHIIRFDAVKYEDRSVFLSYEKALEDLLRILLPVVIGSVVVLTSYSPILIAALIATGLAFLVSFWIPNQEPSRVKFDTGEFIRLLRANRESNVFRTYLAEFLRGINYIGALDILIPIIIFVAFANEFSLGALTSVFSIVSILISLLMGKHLKDKFFKKSIILTGILLFLATLAIVYNVSKPSIVFYNLIYAITVPVLLTIQTLFSYNIIDTPQLKPYRVEHFVVREIIMIAGKLLGLVFLLAISSLGCTLYNLRTALVVLSITILLIPLQIIKFRPNIKGD